MKKLSVDQLEKLNGGICYSSYLQVMMYLNGFSQGQAQAQYISNSMSAGYNFGIVMGC